MYQENVVLCGASAYEQKYYFNKDFDSLPDHVKKELQIMCVLFTEEIGGIFTLEFDDHGNLQFKTEATEADGFSSKCTRDAKAPMPTIATSTSTTDTR